MANHSPPAPPAAAVRKGLAVVKLELLRPTKVRSVLRGRYSVEGHDEFGQDWAPERVAVVAQWSASAKLSRSVCRLIEEFRAAEFDVVLVSACEDPSSLKWAVERPPGVLVLRKPNIGYDFGSWSIAMAARPKIAEARHVILANDSLIGPFAPLGPLLERFVATSCDVWGLTDTMQFGRHLQSYFVGYQHQVLKDAPLSRFWADRRVERTKDDFIWRGEIELSRVLHREGYLAKAAFPHQRIAPNGENPTIRQWERLLEAGFPFLKREVIRNPEVATKGDRAPAVVHALFGEHIADWL
jgi:lipopolysaccharide biosynthesis protein